jgi:predicted transcriptional regulator
MSSAFRKIEPGSANEIDTGSLPMNDRACLRLLVRCGVATCNQLARLVYGEVHETQRRLLRLYRAGLLERTTVAHTPPGRSEFAYRVSSAGHQRLVTRLAPAPASYVRHMLDALDALLALNRTDDPEHPPVQLWLPDGMTGERLGHFVRPDGIVVLTTDAGSAVLALEIDEGTEHRRPIRAKLAAYRRPLAARPSWHLIVVVPSEIRANWMIRQAASLDLGSQAWVVTRSDLARDSLDTVLRSLAPGPSSATMRSVLKPPHRLLRAPVGSRAWLELLAAGGGETEDGALAP